jgi:hypothetical protein
MNLAASIRRALIIVALCASATPIHAERNTSVGAGGGVFWLGRGEDTQFWHGDMATFFVEVSPAQGFGLRLEGSWMKFPDLTVPLVPAPAAYLTDEGYVGRTPMYYREGPELFGGAFSILWFDPLDHVGRTYVLFSGGAYQESVYGQDHTAFIVGPGVGMTLGRWQGIGFEMNVCVGFLDRDTEFMVPLRLFVRM